MDDVSIQDVQDNLSTGASSYKNNHYIIPQLDILEDDSNVYYLYELPGIDTENLNVELSEEEIFIMSTSKLDEQKTTLHQERKKGEFFRKMKLPLNVNTDSIEANFRNGLLEISFPKFKE